MGSQLHARAPRGRFAVKPGNRPVVLISAKEELPAIASRYGAAGYLSKPFEAPQLLSLLERVLD